MIVNTSKMCTGDAGSEQILVLLFEYQNHFIWVFCCYNQSIFVKYATYAKLNMC